MHIKKLIIFVILLITIFMGCEDKEAINSDLIVKQEYTTEIASKVSTNFTLKSMNDEDIKFQTTNKGWKFEKYKGKVVLLNFFAIWCPPCKAEIPHLNKMRADWKDKFEIISLDIGKRDGRLNTKKELSDFIKKFKIKYPVTYGSINIQIMSRLSTLNQTGSIPFSILFDKDGKFIKPYVGLVSNYVMRTDIQKLFGDKNE
jgi:thiol-disulfide isomerase/thioredoxin